MTKIHTEGEAMRREQESTHKKEKESHHVKIAAKRIKKKSKEKPGVRSRSLLCSQLCSFENYIRRRVLPLLQESAMRREFWAAVGGRGSADVQEEDGGDGGKPGQARPASQGTAESASADAPDEVALPEPFVSSKPYVCVAVTAEEDAKGYPHRPQTALSEPSKNS
jgi:hypothetical protein